MSNSYINTRAFEIKDQASYELAVQICPSLSEIPFEAVQGHFFGLTGDLQNATIPPGALRVNDLVAQRDMEPLEIIRLTHL